MFKATANNKTSNSPPPLKKEETENPTKKLLWLG